MHDSSHGSPPLHQVIERLSTGQLVELLDSVSTRIHERLDLYDAMLGPIPLDEFKDGTQRVWEEAVTRRLALLDAASDLHVPLTELMQSNKRVPAAVRRELVGLVVRVTRADRADAWLFRLTCV